MLPCSFFFLTVAYILISNIIILKNKFKILFLISILLISSCRKDEDVNKVNTDDLELINVFKIAVEEPSGLCLDTVNNVLFTVSDNTNNVYKISKTGSLIQEYDIDADDLEGITIYNSELLLADERNKQILKYNIINDELVKYSIDYDNTNANNGFEGIAYNYTDDVIYVLNEKKPGELLTFNNNFDIINTVSLSFANDYSGIFYDSDNNLLWIVSDESESVNKCTLNGELLKSYSVDINKCEGIAIDNKAKLLYLVSDTDSEMYVYKLE